MSAQFTIVVIRTIFILGIINLLSGLLIFFSCRCLPGSKIGAKLMKYGWYQRYFKFHCRIWWVFWTSVVLHAVLALIFVGFPS